MSAVEYMLDFPYFSVHTLEDALSRDLNGTQSVPSG